tara:strand:+ start:22803 stop:24755 length:1953 start_codon:yes stop_codon:yes gene_type:complete
MTNKLKFEKSPYLVQHKNNPVNWMPWNNNSLNLAKDTRKPIFLSIGYASCHWCHVMAHESFESIETAEILNDKFINIKVDREERPDLDYIFQRSLSILTGAQGGWPLSMFLDENAVPFTGGTYFPPKENNGQPSFNQVIQNVAKVYAENREKIISQVDQMRMVFKEIHKKNSVLKQDLEPFAEKILQYMDEENGGFRGAPKFPQFYVFDTILYFYKKNKKIDFLKPVEILLKSISSKGIYDHLIGGISRYTVDSKWIIPHFEKMLYDNILFVKILNEYILISNNNYFKKKLIQTINFINQDFKNEYNLLGSAYDADSDGIEGKYYIWKYDELTSILNEDIEIFKKKFNISKEGNFEGSNILVEKLDTSFDEKELKIIERCQLKLIDIRKKRKKPFFDDKTQTDLNAYWIYTILHSSYVLNKPTLKKKAIENFKILENKLKQKIYHCYEKNKLQVDVFLEDYAYLSLLHIAIYETHNDHTMLKKCSKLLKEGWDLFFDEENNVFQKNSKKDNDLFVKPIDLIDNNIPNGNSIFLLACNKYYNVTQDIFWKNKIDLLKKSFHASINNSYSQMFSYIKILNICEDNITFTFHDSGGYLDNIRNKLIKNYFEKASIIYKKNEKENFLIICKDKICSKKLKTEEEVDNYLDEQSI